MAKAPAERYATARELAEDLSRFLEHQPIRARRATLAQRGLKWARRHPSVVGAAVVLCLLTAVGSLVSAGLITREEMNTKAAYKREKERAREAEKRFQLAKEWVDETFQVCEEELAGQPPNLDGLRRRLLEHALGYYQKLIEERGDSPEDRGELAANLERVQHILADLGLLQGDRLVPLLAERAVQDDLKLTAEGCERINALSRRRAEQFRDLFTRHQSDEERHQGFLALARSSEAVVENILTQEQLARLRQIKLQRDGARAFEDPEVSTALKLTAEQRTRIRTIQTEAFLSGIPRLGPGKPGKPPGPPAPSPLEKIVKTVLTVEQAQQWQKLTGEPFKGPPPFGFPGFHPPHPDHHDRRGPDRDRPAPPPPPPGP
jgi:hypothetical protein